MSASLYCELLIVEKAPPKGGGRQEFVHQGVRRLGAERLKSQTEC
jgi:hypothetical protein